MHNPFQEKIEEHESDVYYIKRALEGDAAALIRFTGIARFAPLKAALWKRAISAAINVIVSPAIRSKIFRCRRG
jgi:hypothetical protein